MVNQSKVGVSHITNHNVKFKGAEKTSTAYILFNSGNDTHKSQVHFLKILFSMHGEGYQKGIKGEGVMQKKKKKDLDSMYE